MNILSPVDFSKCSGQALHYASQLAKMAGATLHLEHVYTDADEELDKARSNEIKKSLAVFYEGYGNKYSNIEVGLHASPDIAGLASHPKINKMNMIVMGTRGASGVKSIFVGSNTVRLIDATTRPVLVVPEGARSPLKRLPILLLADLNPTENLHVFDPLIHLANLLESEIIILHVKPAGEKYETFQLVEKSRLEMYFHDKVKFKMEASFQGDVLTGVDNYLRDNNVQMVVMIQHEHSMLDNIFKKNRTHEMAFHSTIPLLVLNKRDVYFQNN